MDNCRLNHDQVSALILEELALHPMLEPVDLFKLLYQAMFGPAHIVRDLGQLQKSISSELWQIKQQYQPLFQELGPIYTRLSLSALRLSSDLQDRQQKIECLSAWILDSCSEYQDVNQEFLQCWEEHLPLMQRLLKSDSASWDQASTIAQNGELPSHSPLFHTNYHPHYRLVRMDLTEHYQRFMELNK
jgi:hypothetical protein